MNKKRNWAQQETTHLKGNHKKIRNGNEIRSPDHNITQTETEFKAEPEDYTSLGDYIQKGQCAYTVYSTVSYQGPRTNTTRYR